MPYITPAQFLLSYDSRRVAQLLSDDNVPLTNSQILESDILEELIRRATKMIDSAATVGDRYDPSELAELAADEDEGGFIRGLCADITFGLLVKRRGYSAKETGDLAAGYQEAMSWLEQLRSGERIFDLPGVPQAGLPDVTKLGINAGSTSVSQSSRFFGITNTTQPGWFGYGGS